MTSKLFSLTGKVAIVTGAGANGGLGHAIALELARAGANVAVPDINEAGSKATAEEIKSLGCKSLALRCDVTDRVQIEQMVARVNAELGPIDILVNNAGAGFRLVPLVEMTEEFWDQVMALNLRSAFLCCRAVAPKMIERKAGVIINMSSVVARHGGGVGELAYTTAKGGLSAFTRGLAKELAKHGIRVNTVAPGPTDTPFHKGVRTHEELLGIATRIPLGRVGKPEDIVGAVIFLASDAGGYITGQSIEVNGGFWFA
jgi:3-oxoacyl-[acyl-carrier protein] reductase